MFHWVGNVIPAPLNQGSSRIVGMAKDRGNILTARTVMLWESVLGLSQQLL